VHSKKQERCNVRLLALSSFPFSHVRDRATHRAQAAMEPRGATHEAVARAAKDAYEALPKRGKPQPHERTVLAAFLLETTRPGPVGVRLDVVALGTGTKCVGGREDVHGEEGETLYDAHAEAVARRAWKRWMHVQLRNLWIQHPPSEPNVETSTSKRCKVQTREVVQGNPTDAHKGRNDGRTGAPGSPREREGSKADLRTDTGWGCFVPCPCCGKARPHEGTKWHFYVSQTPCGDACLVNEEARTGAKPVKDGTQPPTQHEVEGVQRKGRVRRKPGRGEPTLSMSCSDKIAKWCCLGVQGSLLTSLLCKPIYLDTITVGAGENLDTQKCHEALHRALVGRFRTVAARLEHPFQQHPPAIHTTRIAPSCCTASTSGTVPSGVSINWSAPRKLGTSMLGEGAVHEVTLAASGRKAGAVKKGPGWSSPKTRSSLCKLELYARFQEVCKARGPPEEGWQFCTYGEAKKALGSAYFSNWQRLKDPPSPLEEWLVKPSSLESFRLPPVDGG